MDSGFTFFQLFFGLVGGILPTILWLWLWLKEDTHPEPRKRVIMAFLGGMLAVPLVVPFQAFAQSHIQSTTLLIIVWATIEELFKFGAAVVTSLTKKDDDEPVDPIIYLLTTALGFAALENVLYILNPIHAGSIILSLDTGNLRFIGANLIHIISSSAIGISLGLAFYRSKKSRAIHFSIGLVIAIALHSLFNLFIINTAGKTSSLGIFFAVWIGIVILALFFEKIKSIPAPARELLIVSETELEELANREMKKVS